MSLYSVNFSPVSSQKLLSVFGLEINKSNPKQLLLNAFSLNYVMRSDITVSDKVDMH
jgi:hypothetical protein